MVETIEKLYEYEKDQLSSPGMHGRSISNGSIYDYYDFYDDAGHPERL